MKLVRLVAFALPVCSLVVSQESGESDTAEGTRIEPLIHSEEPEVDTDEDVQIDSVIRPVRRWAHTLVDLSGKPPIEKARRGQLLDAIMLFNWMHPAELNSDAMRRAARRKEIFRSELTDREKQVWDWMPRCQTGRQLMRKLEIISDDLVQERRLPAAVTGSDIWRCIEPMFAAGADRRVWFAQQHRECRNVGGANQTFFCHRFPDNPACKKFRVPFRINIGRNRPDWVTDTLAFLPWWTQTDALVDLAKIKEQYSNGLQRVYRKLRHQLTRLPCDVPLYEVFRNNPYLVVVP